MSHSAPKVPQQIADLNRRLEDLSSQRTELSDKVVEEHKAMNATLDSGKLFARIERELLDNPEKYPTLAAYYDPTK